MSRIFTYTKVTGMYLCADSDEWEEDGTDFEYRVDDDELLDAVVDLIHEKYFDKNMNKEQLRDFIESLDLLDILVDKYENDIKDYFQDIAIKSY